VNRRHPLFGSALYDAAATNNAEVVKFLLKKGAGVNATGGRWYTPLHASVAYKTAGVESLTILLDAGANVNAQPGYSINEGRTPLITASHARNTEAVSLLLAQKDIDVTILAMSDESIAHYIARAGDAENLRLLLELHPTIDIRLKGEYGTPLHTAMNFAWDQLTEGHDAVVEILLDRGLSPNDTCPGAERDVVGWAEEVMNEAREEGEEVPAAAARVLRWWEEYKENVIRRRRKGHVR
jgi:ankyrin repeat protein